MMPFSLPSQELQMAWATLDKRLLWMQVICEV